MGLVILSDWGLAKVQLLWLIVTKVGLVGGLARGLVRGLGISSRLAIEPRLRIGVGSGLVGGLGVSSGHNVTICSYKVIFLARDFF